MKISVIVTTYNRPHALALVLASLAQQTHLAHEVLVADDGSTEATHSVIVRAARASVVPLRHCWQPDHGFRAARVRNLAAAQASGDYLILMDGDCVASADFLAQHARLAQADYFVTGNRVLLSQAATQAWESAASQAPNSQALTPWMTMLLQAQGYARWRKWNELQQQGAINRATPALPFAASVRLAFARGYSRQRWQGARTCNFALWRKDFEAVDGLDESFDGWGHEDADLAVRLLRAGVRRRNSRYLIPLLHLWHNEAPRQQEADNQQRLQRTLAGNHTRATIGLSTHQQTADNTVSTQQAANARLSSDSALPED